MALPDPVQPSHERDRTSLGRRLRGWAERFETNESLDPHVERLERATGPLGSSTADTVLTGKWIGHALHPLLTDFPLGSFLSASYLDVFGGDDSKGASDKLIGFGLAMTLPTALAGAAEWRTADGRSKRVGVVHAALNGGVGTMYLASLVARRKNHRRLGVALGIGGGLLAWASGYLGGHLSLVRGIGVETPLGPGAGRSS
jgi:uncharacterized membrane protein